MSIDKPSYWAGKPAGNPRGLFSTEILWTSDNGKYVVVQGPFPAGLPRTLTSRDVAGAIRARVGGPSGILSRSATTKPHFAKMRRSAVIETHNEWGEICP